MIFSKDEKHHKTIYTLTIDDSEIVPASKFESELINRYSQNAGEDYCGVYRKLANSKKEI